MLGCIDLIASCCLANDLPCGNVRQLLIAGGISGGFAAIESTLLARLKSTDFFRRNWVEDAEIVLVQAQKRVHNPIFRRAEFEAGADEHIPHTKIV